MRDISYGFSSTQTREFGLVLLINFFWINISEIFRYFIFVMPMMRDAFPNIVNIAPMNIPVFFIWGIWDIILLFAVTGFVWLYLERFGYGWGQALLAGTLVWSAIFGILWLGLYNMNLATLQVISVALPLAWVEIVVASFVVEVKMRKFKEVA